MTIVVLQCFLQYINLKLRYSHLINDYIDMCKLSLQLVSSFIAFFLPILPVGLYGILQII